MILKIIFTWWNKLTLGTFLKTLFSGKFVGKDEFGNKIDFVLDGGQSTIGVESTIVNLA